MTNTIYFFNTMSSLSQVCRLSNSIIGGYKSVLLGRANLQTTIVCNYTRKSAEQKLGIDKPKRPLTPFFKFMAQMRPALLAKNPGISARDAISWSSKHWQQLDVETKNQMAKEYEKDKEDYKKIKEMYDASLTEDQKAEIKRVREEMSAAKEKRKLKAEYKELGRPKKPMSSYFLFAQTKNDEFKGLTMKEHQENVKAAWIKLPAGDKAKLEKKASEMLIKYKKDLEAWELKMITLGRSDLVRSKPTRERRTKTDKKSA